MRCQNAILFFHRSAVARRAVKSCVDDPRSTARGRCRVRGAGVRRHHDHAGIAESAECERHRCQRRRQDRWLVLIGQSDDQENSTIGENFASEALHKHPRTNNLPVPTFDARRFLVVAGSKHRCVFLAKTHRDRLSAAHAMAILAESLLRMTPLETEIGLLQSALSIAETERDMRLPIRV